MLLLVRVVCSVPPRILRFNAKEIAYEAKEFVYEVNQYGWNKNDENSSNYEEQNKASKCMHNSILSLCCASVKRSVKPLFGSYFLPSIAFATSEVAM